jgi:hypothetical protein
MAVFLALCLQYFLKVRSGADPRSAILRWQNQVLALAGGSDIWEAYNYPNPPIMALLLSPFMQLSPLWCSLIWFWVKCVLTVTAMVWTFRMVETPDRPFPVWGKVLAVVLGLRAVVGDLTHGNVNLFILFLLVAALYAFSRRHDIGAGLFLALAIACKLTPGLFLPYFLWKRAWRMLAACAVGLVLFFLVVPGLFLGMERNLDCLHSWARKMVLPYVWKGEVTSEHNNQSLAGLVYRLGGRNPSFATYEGYTLVPLEYHNLAQADPETLRLLLKGCMLLFAVAVVWTCRTPTADRAGWRLPAEFSVVILGMLLFSERTWKHHCVTLFLPFAVITYQLSACPLSSRRKRLLIALVVAVVILTTATGTGLSGKLDRLGKLAQVYGGYVWAHLLLLAALGMLLRTRSTISPSTSPKTENRTSKTANPDLFSCPHPNPVDTIAFDSPHLVSG